MLASDMRRRTRCPDACIPLRQFLQSFGAKHITFIAVFTQLQPVSSNVHFEHQRFECRLCFTFFSAASGPVVCFEVCRVLLSKCFDSCECWAFHLVAAWC